MRLPLAFAADANCVQIAIRSALQAVLSVTQRSRHLALGVRLLRTEVGLGQRLAAAAAPTPREQPAHRRDPRQFSPRHRDLRIEERRSFALPPSAVKGATVTRLRALLTEADGLAVIQDRDARRWSAAWRLRAAQR